MRLREVFRFELAYSLSRPTTWLFAAFLFGFACLFAATGGNDQVHVNAPTELASIMTTVGMVGLLVSAAIFGDAALRDVEAGMDPLLFTSSLGRAEYLGGRFLAALAVNVIVLVAIPLGMVAASLTYQKPDELGPFRAAAYVQPFVLFLLPNVVLVGSLLFAIAMRARQVIPVYLGALAFVVGNVVVLVNGNGIRNATLSAIADPLAIAALLDVTQYWTATERNARLVGFPTTLVLNRAVWLAVAATVLAVLHHRFRLAHAGGHGGRRSVRSASATSEPARPVAVPRVVGAFGLRTRVLQVLAVARNSLAEIAGSRAFLATMLGGMGLVMLMGRNVSRTLFDTSSWPVTYLVAGTVLSVRIVPIIFVLIAVYAGELVWRDRDVGVADIADASPVPEGVTLLGRFAALVAMLTALQAAFIVGGVLIQAWQGYYHFELGLYLRMVGLNLVGYVLLAALAMTIHVVVNQKYLGHFVVLTACLFTMLAGQLGVRHHLLVYGTDPGWTYSDMNGFGPFLRPFVWFKLYWAAWALLLAVIASVFLVRGREPGPRRRLAQARARFVGPAVRAAGVAVTLILALGGFIFYNTNVLNEYGSTEDAGRSQAEYERRYKRFEDAPQPTIAAADLRIEIHPEQSAVDVRGTYRLVNRTGAAIDSVHVLLIEPNVEARSISFDRKAEQVRADADVGHRIYALERALAPGDSLQLAFDVSLRPRGFPNGQIRTDVVANGTYFNRSWLPIVGYQPAFELSDDEARSRFGLAPRAPMPAPDDASAGRFRETLRDADLVHVTAIIGTAADQIAVTPGVLQREWREKGRRYFRYATEEPISFSGPVFSARYAVLEDRWSPSSGSGQGVDLRIYHHPTHRNVLDRQVRSMKASLAYYTAQFGPYPDGQLRIVEYPRYGGFGIAYRHTIGFVEDAFLDRVREGEVDQPFYGTAHEIAHQWWGGTMRGAHVRGAALLSESLANYSAMMVTERTHGPEAARRVYDFQMERYLRGRAAQSREVPLLEVEDQPYIAYRKGAVAMYTLREHVGEERVNLALRRYVEKHRDAGPPYPTSLDLYAELRAVTPDSLQDLLGDLFERVTLWDVQTQRAVVEPTGDGAYRVTLDVVGKKVRADSIGNETETPMNDLVEIGVFAPGVDDRLGQPLYVKRHRIRSGRQTISITVPARPGRAGVDPYRKLIDRKGDDNVVDVEAPGTAPTRRKGPRFS